jgi:hypothetical protein
MRLITREKHDQSATRPDRNALLLENELTAFKFFV